MRRIGRAGIGCPGNRPRDPGRHEDKDTNAREVLPVVGHVGEDKGIDVEETEVGNSEPTKKSQAAKAPRPVRRQYHKVTVRAPAAIGYRY